MNNLPEPLCVFRDAEDNWVGPTGPLFALLGEDRKLENEILRTIPDKKLFSKVTATLSSDLKPSKDVIWAINATGITTLLLTRRHLIKSISDTLSGEFALECFDQAFTKSPVRYREELAKAKIRALWGIPAEEVPVLQDGKLWFPEERWLDLLKVPKTKRARGQILESVTGFEETHFGLKQRRSYSSVKHTFVSRANSDEHCFEVLACEIIRGVLQQRWPHFLAHEVRQTVLCFIDRPFVLVVDVSPNEAHPSLALRVVELENEIEKWEAQKNRAVRREDYLIAHSLKERIMIEKTRLKELNQMLEEKKATTHKLFIPKRVLTIPPPPSSSSAEPPALPPNEPPPPPPPPSATPSKPKPAKPKSLPKPKAKPTPKETAKPKAKPPPKAPAKPKAKPTPKPKPKPKSKPNIKKSPSAKPPGTPTAAAVAGKFSAPSLSSMLLSASKKARSMPPPPPSSQFPLSSEMSAMFNPKTNKPSSGSSDQKPHISSLVPPPMRMPMSPPSTTITTRLPPPSNAPPPPPPPPRRHDPNPYRIHYRRMGPPPPHHYSPMAKRFPPMIPMRGHPGPPPRGMFMRPMMHPHHPRGGHPPPDHIIHGQVVHNQPNGRIYHPNAMPGPHRILGPPPSRRVHVMRRTPKPPGLPKLERPSSPEPAAKLKVPPKDVSPPPPVPPPEICSIGPPPQLGNRKRSGSSALVPPPPKRKKK